LATTPAYKDVSNGIQAVAARLRPAGDDKPRAILLRDSLLERDVWLMDAKQPCCTEEEIEGYVWNLNAGRTRGEEPVKEHDHGVDAMRYLIGTCDRVPSGVSYGPKFFG
jgi:phage terminase large subunit